MVVHPPHKGAVISKHTLNLGGMGKLELAVKVATVLDRPVLGDALVYPSAVSPEF